MKWILFFLLFPLQQLVAQHAVSIDIAALHNVSANMEGLNVGSYYHIDKRLTAGVELSRFFPVQRQEHSDEVQLSAWDIDLDFHYLFDIIRDWKLYAIAGIAHAADKETVLESGLTTHERFWSLNSGAGLLYAHGKWAPHIEYHFTYGRQNQHVMLAGVSYEIEWRRHEKNK